MQLTETTRTTTQQKNGFRRKTLAYISLSKPRIIELLLVTTAPVMILATHGNLDGQFLAYRNGAYFPPSLRFFYGESAPFHVQISHP